MQVIWVVLLAVGLAVLIAYLSLVPSDAKVVGWMPPWLQNAGHIGCYAAFAFLIFFGLAPVFSSHLAKALGALVLATGFGVLMEWMQRNARGRHTSYLDALQNAAGALAGVAIALFLVG